jgi:hypothetical protein
MKNIIDSLRDESALSKPIILDLSRDDDRAHFERMVKEGDIKQITDDYEEQQRELFGINNPPKVYAPGFEETFQEHYRALSAERPIEEHGRWAYFP